MNLKKVIKDKTRISTLVTILGAILVLSNLSCDITGTKLRPLARTLTFKNNDVGARKARPIMHTFYQQAYEGEEDLLALWKEEWNRAGFDTKILTMKDARSHKYFKEMKKVIKPILGERYNGLCFYRWLAMATVEGGGWMSDYDVMPTNFPKKDILELPNKGKFSSFQVHVPCLLSGTQDEWLRVTKLLVDAIPRTDKEFGMITDMMAFLKLKNEGNHHIFFRYEVLKKFKYKEPRKVDCEAMSIGRAIHFSHRAKQEAHVRGLFLTTAAYMPQGRAGSVFTFMEDWRDQCQDEATEFLRVE